MSPSLNKKLSAWPYPRLERFPGRLERFRYRTYVSFRIFEMFLNFLISRQIQIFSELPGEPPVASPSDLLFGACRSNHWLWLPPRLTKILFYFLFPGISTSSHPEIHLLFLQGISQGEPQKAILCYHSMGYCKEDPKPCGTTSTVIL